MIETFRHKGLRRLFENDDRSALPQDMVQRIRNLLYAIDQARTVQELDRPGFRLHPLKGDLKGRFAVTVKANWRIVFKFDDGVATDVDFLDYH